MPELFDADPNRIRIHELTVESPERELSFDPRSAVREDEWNQFEEKLKLVVDKFTLERLIWLAICDPERFKLVEQDDTFWSKVQTFIDQEHESSQNYFRDLMIAANAVSLARLTPRIQFQPEFSYDDSMDSYIEVMDDWVGGDLGQVLSQISLLYQISTIFPDKVTSVYHREYERVRTELSKNPVAHIEEVAQAKILCDTSGQEPPVQFTADPEKILQDIRTEISSPNTMTVKTAYLLKILTTPTVKITPHGLVFSDQPRKDKDTDRPLPEQRSY